MLTDSVSFSIVSLPLFLIAVVVVADVAFCCCFWTIVVTVDLLLVTEDLPLVAVVLPLVSVVDLPVVSVVDLPLVVVTLPVVTVDFPWVVLALVDLLKGMEDLPLTTLEDFGLTPFTVF